MPLLDELQGMLKMVSPPRVRCRILVVVREAWVWFRLRGREAPHGGAHAP